MGARADQGLVNRRDFLLAGAGAGALACRAPQRPPNVVVILADDLGYSDIGCYGGEIESPNIDRIAGQGVRFTHFYNAARCCPTRAALMTGLYQHQAGVGHMWREPMRESPSYQGYLNNNCATIAEALRPAGYRTCLSGKWHLAGWPDRPGYEDNWPTRRGFERFYGILGGGANYFRPRPLYDQEQRIGGNLPTDYYFTDAVTGHACRFVSDTATEPFFLYAAYTAPHFPLHARPEDIAKYRGRYMEGWEALRKRRHQRQLESGIVDRRWQVSPRDELAPRWESVENKDEFDLRMAIYAAQVDRMDQGVGRILDSIEAAGQTDNTLVVFLSDNGGTQERVSRGEEGAELGSADSYESVRRPWANMSNTPFRRYKRWVHEGGIATPFVARWPGVIAPGSMCGETGHVMDLMPTCLEMAGAEYPSALTPLEGRSLLPVFEGGAWSDPRTLCFEHEGNRAIIRGRDKLVSYVDEAPPYDWELYDLEADRTETQNLAGDRPELLTELDAAYSDWASRCGVLGREELEEVIRSRHLVGRIA